MLMTTDAGELLDSALSAYQNGEFKLAAKQFGDVLKRFPEEWNIHFYFAMALAQDMQTKLAQNQFRSISESCPDPIIRHRAEIAASTLRSFQ